MAALRAFRALPPEAAAPILGSLLPAYPLLRGAQARRLSALFAASPFAEASAAAPALTLPAYYRRRLDLMLRGLRLHGRPLDCCSVRATG